MFNIEWDDIKVVEETPDENSISKERTEQMNENLEVIAAILARAYARARRAASSTTQIDFQEAA